MTLSRAERVRTLFDEVVDLAPAERITWLERSGAPPDVQAEVLELVRADEAPHTILDASHDALAEAAGVTTEGSVESFLGRNVGPYRIIDVLGHGGMGAVFLAERADVGLKVALKLVRGLLGDPSRIARFRREERALARLSHPFIAQLLDVGVAEDGTPYLAMGYVQGRPITAWCSEQALDVAGRLRLFLDLCDAVAFAHRHLVVHRDIKPSNVMVTPEGRVMLLDFGVAKMLEEGDEDRGLTHTGSRVLSPEYASPEQVRGEPVSTATDVHGLGVLLYEMLTGARPFGARGVGPTALMAAVVNDEAGRPSGRMDPKPAGVDDLDAICLKALAKAPGARYASVADLADDVRRHLEGLPVQAHLPTLAYRAGKFVRRHRVGVVIGALAGMVLLSGVGTVAWQAYQTKRALEEAQYLSNFLLNVFQATDPAETRGADAPMKSFLDLSMVYMDELRDRPALQARTLAILSQAYVGLGEYRTAENLARRSLELRRGPGGGADADVAVSLVALGSAQFEAGDLAEASASLRSALGLERGALGVENLETTRTMLQLAEALGSQGEYAEAEGLAREALAVRLDITSRRSEEVADALSGLGKVLEVKGGSDPEAERLLRASLTMREELYGPDDFRVDRSLVPLGMFLTRIGRGEEGEALARRSLELRRRVYGENHPRVVAELNNLAEAILAQGRVSEARDIYRQVVSRYERAFDGDHPMLAVAITNLSGTFAQEGMLDSAEVHLRRALDMRLRMDGPDSPAAARLRHDLGVLQVEEGLLADAEASFRPAYRVQETALGSSNPATLRTQARLGDVARRLGRLDEAETILRATVAAQAETLGEPNPDLTRSLGFLGRVLTDQSRWEEAGAVHERALLLARTALAPLHPIRWEVVAGIMDYYRARGRPEDAERVRREEAGVAVPGGRR